MQSWIEPVLATFVVPLVFMVGDYIMRLKTGLASQAEVLHQVGGDCCILSLGATGGVFIDPHVQHMQAISSGLAPALVIGLICIMRYGCIVDPRKDHSHSPGISILLGLSSMFLVSGVLVAGLVLDKS